jgi:hypothetical protein
MKRYTPEKFNTITSSDDIGALIDLPRITGETLYSYKKRVLESSERVANSSYEGLINGINRELNLERKEVLEITLRNRIVGNIDHPEITYSGDTITDNRSYAGVINGVTVLAVGNTITITGHIIEDNELTGLYLLIDSITYRIKGNLGNEVYIESDSLNNLVGQPYLIRPNWEPNSLIGLSLLLHSRRYLILENDDNSIRLDANIKTSCYGTYEATAIRPRVHCTAARILLYKEYFNEDNFQIDMEIKINEKSLTHKEIVKQINENSKFFVAEDIVPLEDSVPAFSLKQQDSDIPVYGESVPGSKFFKLKNKNIKNGTAKFLETEVFLREVEDLDTAPYGSFFTLDYNEGIVRSKKVPNGRGTLSYIYSDIPFRLESTPAIIVPFVDKEADSFLFAQKQKTIFNDSRDRFISSQPKSKMIEYISELLSVKDQTWGK